MEIRFERMYPGGYGPIRHSKTVILEIPCSIAKEMIMKGRSPIHVEPKGWGREIWIANNSEYCGKVLEIDKGKRCSFHFHKLKLESFYLRCGKAESASERVARGLGDRGVRTQRWRMHGCAQRFGASDGGSRGQ